MGPEASRLRKTTNQTVARGLDAAGRGRTGAAMHMEISFPGGVAVEIVAV